MAGRVIRLKELITHTGLSRSAIYDRMDPQSPRHDPSFPRSFPLGGTAVGWYLAEVDQWLQGCAEPGQKRAPARRTGSEVSNRSPAKYEAPPNSSTSRGATGEQASAVSLADALTVGGQLNAKLINYLKMTAWSPAMAAMLVSGVEPPPNCEDIPREAMGLDGKHLAPSDQRLQEARKVLKAWTYTDGEDDLGNPSSFTPLEFVVWCVDDAEIDSDWLRYMVELMGMRDRGAPDFSAARLDLALRQTKLQ